MERLPSSFRDPCGFVFQQDGVLYRQINRAYASDYRKLHDSGLYVDLVARGWLIAQIEVDVSPAVPGSALVVVRPDLVPFISYPYEWCFSQWQDAALLTLDIQEQALQRGMTLRDASAFNVQFRDGRAVFIDTLSFEALDVAAQPGWQAYRQFCEHFLAPLSLMAFRDARLGRLLASHLDGVPLDLACCLLPWRAFFQLHRWLHLRVHAWGQKRGSAASKSTKRTSAREQLALVDSLRSAVLSLRWRDHGSAWSDYYEASASYDAAARQAKETAVSAILSRVKPGIVWDLGCNTGAYSRLAAAAGAAVVVAIDSDHACIERLYREGRTTPKPTILPLQMDLTNPSSGLGWDNQERSSLEERGSADLVLALAVVHHWAIAANIPLEMIANFLSKLGRELVIEFVPKEDPMTQRLLSSRQDIFPDYHQVGFEQAFGRHFKIAQTEPLAGSKRTLYHLTTRRGS